MSLKERTINVDIMTKEYTKLKYKQGESGQNINIKLFKNGKQLDLIGLTVNAFFEKTNGEILEKSATINDNVATITLSKQILNIAGKIKTELYITKGDELVISFTIIIDVEESINASSAVEEKEEWDSIKDLLIKSNNLAMIDDNNVSNKTTSSSYRINSQLEDIKNDFNSQIKEKANRTITDNIQGQINNLVLGAVGDGNNPEVIQARGEYALLNDRLMGMDTETDKIKKIVTWTTQFIDRSSLINDSYYSISNNQVIAANASGYNRHPEITFKLGTYKLVGFSTGFTIIENKSDGTLKRLSEFITDSNAEYGEHSITVNYDFTIYPTTNKLPMMIDKTYFPQEYIYGIYNYEVDGVRFSIMDNTVTQNMRDIALLKETINAKTSTDIIVGTSTSANFSTIESALASITDSSENKIYNILIEDGTYEFKMNGTFVPSYINFIGESGNRDKCIIKGEVADNGTDDEITNSSTFNIKESNNFKNLTITAKNMRYCIHSESGGINKDWTQILENCVLIHHGNQGAIDYRNANDGDASKVWTSCHAWGEGASSGAYAEFNNCIFKGTVEPWYVHEPTSNDGEKPYIHILNNCDIINTTLSNVPSWLTSVGIDNTTDKGVLNQVVFNNCNFGNGKITINGNFPIDVQIKGSNNVYVRRTGLTTDYPSTDFTNYKTYIGSEPLTGGEVLKYVNGINLVDIADSNTDSSLIAGVSVSAATQNSLVKIVSKTYINKTGNFGQKIYTGDNGTISTNGTNVIGICFGECSLLY